MTNVIDILRSYADQTAICHGSDSISYNDLANKIKHNLEAFTQLQIKAGDTIAIQSDCSIDSISMLFALHENKNIIVPIVSELESELNEKLAASQASALIRFSANSPLVSYRERVKDHSIVKKIKDKNESGLILFSSGSTGKPKAMVHSLSALLEQIQAKKSRSLNTLIFLLFDHIGGINTLLNTLCTGSTAIIPESRKPEEICALIDKFKIRILPASPTFLNLLLMSNAHENHDLSSLRMITYGTEVMPSSLLSKIKTAFPRVKLLQTFGTSETGIANTRSKSSDSTLMKIDDPDLDYKIVDNELWLKSKTQVIGYLNASMECFTEDGWFKTGDLVEIEGEYLKIIGRSKEVINVGGEKVLPGEVESAILQIEHVLDVLVYAEASPITNQTVAADIVVDSEFDTGKAKKIVRKHCLACMEKYKAPTKVNVVSGLNASSRFKKERKVPRA